MELSIMILTQEKAESASQPAQPSSRTLCPLRFMGYIMPLLTNMPYFLPLYRFGIEYCNTKPGIKVKMINNKK
jgi:hypothetical protein